MPLTVDVLCRQQTPDSAVLEQDSGQGSTKESDSELQLGSSGASQMSALANGERTKRLAPCRELTHRRMQPKGRVKKDHGFLAIIR